jgi:hypothetical protein
MNIGARPHVCGDFNIFNVSLTLVNVLFSASFVYLILFCCSCAKVGTSSIDWDQLSRSHLKMETESIIRNVVF